MCYILIEIGGILTFKHEFTVYYPSSSIFKYIYKQSIIKHLQASSNRSISNNQVWPKDIFYFSAWVSDCFLIVIVIVIGSLFQVDKKNKKYKC